MENKATSIIFTGDIGFDRYMDKKWEDEQLLSPEILDFFHSADHVVANVEGALINAEDDGSKGIFFHSMDPAATAFLKKINADIFCLANNHTMDAGRAGIESTKKIAAEMGSQTVGSGLDINEASAPLYLSEAGGIGMIAVGYQPTCIPAKESSPGCFAWDDFERIEARIKEIKKKCRWCIVISHGGEEFAALPSPYTRDRYLKYIELGADIVVGHHPHVPENYELLDGGKAIFYSLGNFIFDTDYQRAHAYTDIGLLLKLNFSEDGFTFDALATELVRGEERIKVGNLPAIFTDVPAEEYEKLIPLAAKAFVIEESRRRIFMNPDKFKNASREVWEEYFASTDTQGYVKGEHMDFLVICPLADRADDGEWKESKLEGVKEYLLSLL